MTQSTDCTTLQYIFWSLCVMTHFIAVHQAAFKNCIKSNKVTGKRFSSWQRWSHSLADHQIYFYLVAAVTSFPLRRKLYLSDVIIKPCTHTQVFLFGLIRVQLRLLY